MTDEEVISEFRQLVHNAIKANGKESFVDRRVRELEVKYKELHLVVAYYVNGGVHYMVYNYHTRGYSSLVFRELSEGRGIYNSISNKDRYIIEELRMLLPVLRRLTVLERLASI